MGILSEKSWDADKSVLEIDCEMRQQVDYSVSLHNFLVVTGIVVAVVVRYPICSAF